MNVESDHSHVPVLEIGGTHVTAAVVSLEDLSIRRQRRIGIDAEASAEELLTAFVNAAKSIDCSSDYWGVAIPGPFDYDAGIARYSDVGKFDSLNGTNVRSRLEEELKTEVFFLNDADAFGIGEAVAGAGADLERVVILTLGTGIGSAFLDATVVAKEGRGVPPLGSAHLLRVAGRPLEDFVSRRAIRSEYLKATGSDEDVKEIAERALGNDPQALAVLAQSMGILGTAIAPWVADFDAGVVVVGGAISQSWEVISPALADSLNRGLASCNRPSGPGLLRKASLGESGPLLGAAIHARRQRAGGGAQEGVPLAVHR